MFSDARFFASAAHGVTNVYDIDIKRAEGWGAIQYFSVGIRGEGVDYRGAGGKPGGVGSKVLGGIAGVQAVPNNVGVAVFCKIQTYTIFLNN